VAAGSFSNLYRGYYCGQEVAVKILKELQDDASQFQEFLQEVSIMRKVCAAESCLCSPVCVQQS
jgi:abortive infection bacteriophage resistance protein